MVKMVVVVVRAMFVEQLLDSGGMRRIILVSGIE